MKQMVYTVKLDDQLLYDPRLESAWIQNPKLSQAVNSFDGFDFTVYPEFTQGIRDGQRSKSIGNTLYDQLKRRKSIYKVYKDGKLISRGRVMSDEKNRIGAKLVTCNGQGDFLNDSRVPIYDLGVPVVDLLRFYINEHNKQMHGDKEKMFTLRNVTVADPNNYLPRANSTRPTTWQEIQDKLIGPLGGFLVFDYDDAAGVCYLDYLADSPFSSNQKVQRGKNLLDLTDKIDASELYTAVIGYGAQIGQSTGGKEAPRLNVMDINGDLDYVFDQSAVDEYGWNFDVQTWDEVTTQDVLLKRMQEQLAKDIQLDRNLQLTAVDLSVIDKAVEDFSPLDYIWGETVINKPECFMIDKVDTELQNPASNKLTIGKQVTLSSITNDQSVVKGNDGDAGLPGFNPSLMNDNVTFPANAMGGVLSYEGGNTNISVLAGDGSYFEPVAYQLSDLIPSGAAYTKDLLVYRPNSNVANELAYMDTLVAEYDAMNFVQRAAYDLEEYRGAGSLEEWIRLSTRTQYIRAIETNSILAVNTGDSYSDSLVVKYRSMSSEARVEYDIEEAFGAKTYEDWVSNSENRSTSFLYLESISRGPKLENGQFSVSAAANGITLGKASILPANHIIAYANPSNMDVKATTAFATFTIFTRTSGQTSVTTKVQNFTKLPMGITGDAGVDSWTYYRYSPYLNGGASDGSQMTSLPNADTIYIGRQRTVNVFASSKPSDYTWNIYEKATIAKQTTEPVDRWPGRLWQYTGTSAITVGTVAIQPQTVYIWNGGRWDLYLMRSTNLQVDNAFITNAMIQSLNADKIVANDLSAIALHFSGELDNAYSVSKNGVTYTGYTWLHTGQLGTSWSGTNGSSGYAYLDAKDQWLSLTNTDSAGNPKDYVNLSTGRLLFQNNGNPTGALMVNSRTIFDWIYPPGSFYISSHNENPRDLFGVGTWTLVKDRVLIGAGGSYGLNSMGGSSTHSITAENLPNHSHPLPTGIKNSGSEAGGWGLVGGSGTGFTDRVLVNGGDNNTGGVNSGGNGSPMDTMPPYMAVNIWRRDT
jgi:hypothetical protein